MSYTSLNPSFVPHLKQKNIYFWRREVATKRIAKPRKHILRNPRPEQVLCNFWRCELRISGSSAPPFQENQSSCERGARALLTILRFHLPATRWSMSLMIERVLPWWTSIIFCWISDKSSSLTKVLSVCLVWILFLLSHGDIIFGSPLQKLSNDETSLGYVVSFKPGRRPSIPFHWH